MSGVNSFPHSPFIPHDPEIKIYDNGTWGHALPLAFTNYNEEVMTWKESVYLHAGLNPTLTYRLTGPDALKLLRENSTNNFDKFSIGASKHLIMCGESGHIMAHGMALRTGEEEFLTYWLAPYLNYLVETSEYDVSGEDISGQVFMYQIAGPRSLEVLEHATGEDLHDIKFIRHRPSVIHTADGIVDVSVMRIGMGGTLAYEVHGKVEDAIAVYNAILAAGEPFGMRRLGWHSYYPANHTENGFPQGTAHFPYAWSEDAKLDAYMNGLGDHEEKENLELDSAAISGHHLHLYGSMGDDMEKRFCTPFDVGWGRFVHFNHDFVGRAALEKIAAAPPRTIVTLVWNPDDILDTFASQFQPGEPYQIVQFPHDGKELVNDRVMNDGVEVGMSMGRTYSFYYRDMISICKIDTALAEIGKEVTIIWGEPGTRQKEIRATVARYPYLDLPRNEDIDVETIPRVHKTSVVAGGAR